MLGSVLRNSRALAAQAARGQVRRMSLGEQLKDIKDVKVKDAARWASDKVKDPAAQQAARVCAPAADPPPQPRAHTHAHVAARRVVRAYTWNLRRGCDASSGRGLRCTAPGAGLRSATGRKLGGGEGGGACAPAEGGGSVHCVAPAASPVHLRL